MSVFIGKDNNNNSILHITKNQHNISELKSGMLDDTIFHNDMKYFTYNIYEITETITRSDYANGPASGNNWSIDPNGNIYTFKVLGVSYECAIKISDSYTSSENIILYLDSNYNQLDLDTSNIAFVHFAMPLSTWSLRDNYGICRVPVPTWHSTIMPCLYKNLNVDVKYVCVLNLNNSFVNGYGTLIKPNENIFKIGNSDFNNLKYVSLGQDISDPTVKKINSKMSLVDTSKFSGNGSLILNSSDTQIKLNNHVLFSSANSMYGIKNIIDTSVPFELNELNYTNNLMFSGVSNGDIVYMRMYVYNGMFIYSEGKSFKVVDVNYQAWVLCSGGNVYVRTWASGSNHITTFLRYAIFK